MFIYVISLFFFLSHQQQLLPTGQFISSVVAALSDIFRKKRKTLDVSARFQIHIRT